MLEDAREHPSSRGNQPPGRWRPLVIHLAAGTLLGLVAQRADGFATWSSALTSHGGIWLVALIVVGVAAPTARAAAERAVALFVGVLAGYYAASAADYGYAPRFRLVVFWAALAVSVAPAAAALARRMTDTSRPAAAIGGLLAGGLLAEATLVALLNPSDRRWAVVVFDALAGLTVLAVVAVRTRRPLTALGAGAAATALGAGTLVLLTELYNRV